MWVCVCLCERVCVSKACLCVYVNEKTCVGVCVSVCSVCVSGCACM